MCVRSNRSIRVVVGWWLWHLSLLWLLETPGMPFVCVWPCPRPVDSPRWGLSPRRQCVVPTVRGATFLAVTTAPSTQLPAGPLISLSRLDSLLINYSIIDLIESSSRAGGLSLSGEKVFFGFHYSYTSHHHCGAEHRHQFTTGKFWRRLQDGLSALDQVTEPHPRSNSYISPTCIS